MCFQNFSSKPPTVNETNELDNGAIPNLLLIVTPVSCNYTPYSATPDICLSSTSEYRCFISTVRLQHYTNRRGEV